MLIRRCKLEDAIILHKELGCNPEMLRYTGWNPYSSLDDTKEFLLNTIDSKEDYSWIIEEDGSIVGTIGAYDYCSQDESIEIGYSIFQKCWGKGYATQAIKLACDKISIEHSAKIIKAWCADENIASAKALERNGFERKEIIESAINVCGEQYDQVIYEKVIIR